MISYAFRFLAITALLTGALSAGPIAGDVCTSGTGAEYQALGLSGCTVDGHLITFYNSDYSLWDTVMITPFNDGLGGFQLALNGNISYNHSANMDPFTLRFGWVIVNDLTPQWENSMSATFSTIGADYTSTVAILLNGNPNGTIWDDDPNLPGTVGFSNVPRTRGILSYNVTGAEVVDLQGSGNFTLTNYSYTYTPIGSSVPEPSTALLIMPVLIGLVGTKLHRR